MPDSSSTFQVPAYSKDDLPTGFQRADGVDTNIGSGNTVKSLAYIAFASVEGPSIASEETPDSPMLERAEQFTSVHKFTMSWSNAINWHVKLKRGSLYKAAATSADDPYTAGDDMAIFKVLSCKITHGAGNTGTLEITSEALNIDVPPDNFNISAIELGINILKHPRYYFALSGRDRISGVLDAEQSALNQQVIQILQQYMNNPNLDARNSIGKMIYDAIGHPGTYAPETGEVAAEVVDDVTLLTGTDFAKKAALEIIQKYWLGIENPYIVGWQLTYTTYWWRPPALHPGGILQEPYYTVDEQFLWRKFGEGIEDVRDTIFYDFAHQNPACYSSDGTTAGVTRISWLRKADTLSFERTFFKVESTWIGSPVGNWDAELFNSGNTPPPFPEDGDPEFLRYQPLWTPVLPPRPTGD